MTDVRIISPDDWARYNECENDHLKIIVDKRGYVFPFYKHKLVEITIRVGEDGPDVISSTSPEARKILELEAEIKRLRARHAEVVKWLQDGAVLFSGKYDLFKEKKVSEEND